MRIAETVTFGGSGLYRHATLRRDAAGLQDALGAGTVLPIWRGKPLLHQDRLAWVASDHPVLALAGPPIFLGLDAGTPRFAADVSDWSPEAGADAPEAGFFDQTVQHHPAMTGGEGFAEGTDRLDETLPRGGKKFGPATI